MLKKRKIGIVLLTGMLSIGTLFSDVTYAQTSQILTSLDTTGVSAKSGSGSSSDSTSNIMTMPGAQAISKLYETLLGRKPDNAGLKHYIDKMAAGEIDLTGIARTIKNSPEYKNRVTSSSSSPAASTAATSTAASTAASTKTGTVTASSLNVRSTPWGEVIGALPQGAEVKIIGTDPNNRDWTKISYQGKVCYVASTFVSLNSATSNSRTTAGSPSSGGISISETGKSQLRKVVSYALGHHRGASRGMCFNAVWGYLTSSGYGKLRSWGDLPNMQSGEARHFSEYMNSSSAHLQEAGLQRIDNISPPIKSPHDSRIPVGAVIVVAAGSYGTRHATAGDIVIKAGTNHFVNDGPNMDYGTASSWYGKVLGVYVPR